MRESGGHVVNLKNHWRKLRCAREARNLAPQVSILCSYNFLTPGHEEQTLCPFRTSNAKADHLSAKPHCGDLKTGLIIGASKFLSLKEPAKERRRFIRDADNLVC